MEAASSIRIPLQLTRGSIVASIQIDLSDEIMHQFRHDLLSLVKESGATRVILDVSGLAVLDLAEFASLQRTVAMAGLMGARTVVAGLRPGVVSSLVELDAPLDWVEAALNLDQAFSLFSVPGDYQGTMPVLEPPTGIASEPLKEPPNEARPA